MLNRTAIVLRYREPFVRWINEADPYTEDPDISVGPDEQTVYLIHQIENRDELDESDRIEPRGAVRKRARRLVYGRGSVARESYTREV